MNEPYFEDRSIQRREAVTEPCDSGAHLKNMWVFSLHHSGIGGNSCRGALTSGWGLSACGTGWWWLMHQEGGAEVAAEGGGLWQEGTEGRT